MTYTTSGGTLVSVQCGRCGLLTPEMSVGSEKAAAEIIQAAGWVIRGKAALCPRCRSRPFLRRTG
jgi:hypothetical protein